jgi:glutamate-1-semialdehyde aminotransferase
MVCNTGTEATMLAWRLMRAATDKPMIAKFEGCYHGWHDYAQWSVALDPDNMGPAERPNMTPGCAGIPDGARDTVLLLPFNDNAFRMIEEHAHELAGVAIEPVLGGGMLTVDKAFLQELRDVTQKAGVLLHFDEVITGFRLALGGCQELTGVLPDVATYGKIIGGGLPIGAIGCSKEMVAIAQKTDDGFSAAGTFSGNPMTLATGAATLKYLQENRQLYGDMMAKGEFLRSGFNDFTVSNGYPLLYDRRRIDVPNSCQSGVAGHPAGFNGPGRAGAGRASTAFPVKQCAGALDASGLFLRRSQSGGYRRNAAGFQGFRGRGDGFSKIGRCSGAQGSEVQGSSSPGLRLVESTLSPSCRLALRAGSRPVRPYGLEAASERLIKSPCH